MLVYKKCKLLVLYWKTSLKLLVHGVHGQERHKINWLTDKFKINAVCSFCVHELHITICLKSSLLCDCQWGSRFTIGYILYLNKSIWDKLTIYSVYLFWKYNCYFSFFILITKFNINGKFRLIFSIQINNILME
jgi:hypothetical protein